MGKSIRSKRKKRLRTQKRELVEGHYDKKDESKIAAMEAALAAPKIELPQRKNNQESEYQGRSGLDSMEIENDGPSNQVSAKKLKVKGGIKKRGKSKSRLKKEKRRKIKLNF